MRLHFILLSLLVLLLLAVGGAVAQENNSSGATVDVNVGNVTGGSNCDETMDEFTSLCSSSIDGDSDSVVLVIKSDLYQRATIVDAGAFSSGGQVPKRTVDLQQGRNRIEFGVRSTSGDVGVGITLGRSDRLYAEWVSQSGTSLPGSPTGSDVPTVLLTSILTSVSLLVGGAWYFKRGGKGGVRRVF